MSEEVTITISAVGKQGSGKTRAIDLMAAAVRTQFTVIAQTPRQEISNAESYTFKIRLL